MMMYLISGAVLGLSAGIAPGPLLALVISESIRYGLGAGVKVAFAPLVTDLPIVIVTCLAISRLTHFHAVLGGISLLGALYVAYLGYEGLCTKEFDVCEGDINVASLRKGIITNFLNPHPYLFWFSVGSPTIIKAYSTGIMGSAAFIGGFYTFLVGSKVILAFFVHKSRHLILGNAYRYTMMILGVALLIFAVFLLRDGLTLLGLI